MLPPFLRLAVRKKQLINMPVAELWKELSPQRVLSGLKVSYTMDQIGNVQREVLISRVMSCQALDRDSIIARLVELCKAEQHSAAHLSEATLSELGHLAMLVGALTIAGQVPAQPGNASDLESAITACKDETRTLSSCLYTFDIGRKIIKEVGLVGQSTDKKADKRGWACEGNFLLSGKLLCFTETSFSGEPS